MSYNTLYKIKELSHYIMHDMLEPIGYLPLGLISGILFFLILKLLRTAKILPGKTTPKNRDFYLTLLVIYIAVLLKLALFSREPGSRTTVSLTLFDTWGNTMQAHAFFVENIIMFLPFGILIPKIYPLMRNFFVCTLAGFCTSMTLELIQLITERGFCQLDDIVTNTIGAAAGYIIYITCTAFSVHPYKRP